MREFRHPEVSAGITSGMVPRAAELKSRRTTSGSITTLQLTVPSNVSIVPDHALTAGFTLPRPI
jgi:hypothetical protein